MIILRIQITFYIFHQNCEWVFNSTIIVYWAGWYTRLPFKHRCEGQCMCTFLPSIMQNNHCPAHLCLKGHIVVTSLLYSRHLYIEQTQCTHLNKRARFDTDIHYSKLGAVSWVQNGYILILSVPKLFRLPICICYANLQIRNMSFRSVIWLILAMIGWEWTKTNHLFTRDNFGPNLQHLIYYCKYLWRSGPSTAIG